MHIKQDIMDIYSLRSMRIQEGCCCMSPGGKSFPPGWPNTDDSSDCPPSLICAWVKGDKPREPRARGEPEPFFRRPPEPWSPVRDGVEGPLAVVLVRRGRPVPEDRDGGRSSVSTGVVLREGVRE